MKEAPVSAEELALGKDSLVRSLPGRFETSAQAAGSFATLFVYDLGLDYFTKYIQRLGAIDTAAVRAAAEKYLVPERLVVVAVGDRAKDRIRPEEPEPWRKRVPRRGRQCRDAEAVSRSRSTCGLQAVALISRASSCRSCSGRPLRERAP